MLENCNLYVRCMEPGNERRAQGSLWEGAVSRRLTEGESPGLLDAAPKEALAVDKRSLLQSASRPAPSQREPLACTARFGLPFIHPDKLQGTSKNYPFGFWADLLPSQCLLKIPQYIQYSGISKTFVRTKSLVQNRKK